jgi:ABC-type transport system involved in multi-copper enzyme maturation permease subunit
MLPGPVFYAELLTSSRRIRHYFTRALYGLIILAIITQAYYSRFNTTLFGAPEVPIREMAGFGQSIFSTFVFCQGVAAIVLTPALVAGAIADERQRKTLHYLLTSRLNGAEIVLGKLGARLLVLAVFVTAGMPIMSMLGLFGGVAPELVGWSYAGTLSTILALAGVSILVSTGSRRPRDAILLVFALEAFWLLLPAAIASFGNEWPILFAAVEPFQDALLLTNPFFIAPRGSSKLTFEQSVLVMIGVHLGVFLVTTLWAVVRLRPGFRREGERLALVRLLRQPQGRWRLFPRPSCPDDDPMLWKERYVARLRGRARAMMSLLGLVLLAYVGYWTLRMGMDAWEDLVLNDFGVFPKYAGRDSFNNFIQLISAFLYVVIGIGVAVSAASSCTSEREGDTWISLIASTLTGPEIVLAKIMGSITSMRVMLCALVTVWVFGVATGSLHPFGLLASLAQLVCYLGFIAALGVCVSLQARTTARALAFTITSLAFLNGGYFLCLILYMPETALVCIGVSPLLLATSLISYRDLWVMLGWDAANPGMFDLSPATDLEWGATLLLGPLCYGLVGAAIAWWTGAHFDALIDRPRQEAGTRTIPVHTPKAIAVTG